MPIIFCCFAWLRIAISDAEDNVLKLPVEHPIAL